MRYTASARTNEIGIDVSVSMSIDPVPLKDVIPSEYPFHWHNARRTAAMCWANELENLIKRAYNARPD